MPELWRGLTREVVCPVVPSLSPDYPHGVPARKGES